MRSAVERSSELSWGLWWGQILAILRLEVRKNLFGRRSLPIYLLACLPVLLMLFLALFPMPTWKGEGLGAASHRYAWIYQIFILRAVVFFGCVAIFTNLFRGEVLDRSLHFYLLAPLRREVLVVGKYLYGLLTTSILFGAVTLVTYLLLYVPYRGAGAAEYLFDGPGLAHLGAYLAVTLLACIGYGAVFLIVGLLFRNPILPAAALLGWELVSFLLPPFLKKLSVIHYLKGLCPVPITEGAFAVLAEPPPPVMSVLGLLLLTALVLVVAGLRIRRLQIDYGRD